MLNSAVVWKNDCGDYFKAFAFDRDVYDTFDVITKGFTSFAGLFRTIEVGDTIDIIDLREDDFVWEWVRNTVEGNPDTLVLALVNQRESIYETGE